ncbi:MAG: PQQ-dependent sugar dehydrogenase [Anaerolineales bacterium]
MNIPQWLRSLGERLIMLAGVGLTMGIAVLAWQIIGQPPDESDPSYRLQTISDGLNRPTGITHAGDTRLFITEQGGRVMIVDDGALLPEPFLDITAQVTTRNVEQGLLGLAFHPDYAENRYFFVHYSDIEKGDTMVMRYQTRADDPNRADPDSGEQVLFIEQPSSRHNGGQLVFGADGYLYIGLGDGAREEDRDGHGQDPSTLLGAILRLDVDELPYRIPPDNPYVDDPTARPEVWAYGLRNPWRFSFDAESGDLWIGDVGELTYEEVNYVPAAQAPGSNFGWSVWEGTWRTDFGAMTLGGRAEATMPVHVYEQSEEGNFITGTRSYCAVIGGYVYRGANLPDLTGRYLFGDWCAGTIWTLTQGADDTWEADVLHELDEAFAAFGQGSDRELYLASYAGTLYRLAAAE